MKSSENYDDKCPCCGRPYDEPKATKKASEGDFEAFWSIYPKKVAKGYCRDIWKRKKPCLEVVIPAIRRAIASPDWQKEGGKFIPNPSTWLNQGRYEDEGMDYKALVPKANISSLTPNGINEKDAQSWRVRNYPESSDLPFEDWPIVVRQEYLRSIRQPRKTP